MKPIQILIVEDDPIIAADIADRLGEMGFSTLGPVASGEAAVLFFENHAAPPDLVLMDVQLEGPLDGIEAAKRISGKLPRLPVVFLTSNSDEATFGRAKTARPAAFLAKPFRGKDLRHAIELAIANSAEKPEPAERPSEPVESQSFLLNDRLFVKSRERFVRVFFEEIKWAEADDYYCKIAVGDHEILLTHTLGKFADSLAARPEFLRVHRSFIVNLRHVEQIGELFLHIGKKQVPVSKSAREELLARFQRL